MEGDLDSCPTDGYPRRRCVLLLAQRPPTLLTLTLRVSGRPQHGHVSAVSSTCHQRFFGRVRTSFGLRLPNPTLVLMS